MLLLSFGISHKDADWPMLTERDLQHGLRTSSFGSRIYAFERIDSTNSCAKALAGCSAPEGTIVLAEHQTAGRGRLGRSWTANPNENLTFSIILRPKLSPDSAHLLSLYVAVAVAEAVGDASGLTVECKWPNDLLVKGRKIAGILLEAAMHQDKLDFVVIGIGINVNQTRFPQELKGKATSLRNASGTELDRGRLFRAIMENLEDHYNRLSASGFQSVVSEWLSRTSMLNRKITVSMHGSPVSGVVKGLNRRGGLVVNSHGKEHVLFAGDVSILEGYS